MYSKRSSSVEPSITLAISSKAKKMKADGIDVVSFSAGEPDFRTPKNIRDAAIDAIENKAIVYTASSGMPELKDAICGKLKRENNLDYKPSQIIVSNGAKHSLFNALQAICNPEDEVIIPVPFWVSYPEMVKMADGTPVFVEAKESNGFRLTPEDLEATITDKTKAIIFNSPSNPTGAVYSEDEIRAIADICVKHNIFIIADEIYEKLTYEGTHFSIASISEEVYNLTITINGMSKGYAMTGWRMGYLAAPQEIATIINNIQSHATSGINTVTQYASIEALNGDQSSIEEMKKAFQERKEYMVEKINSIPNLSTTNPNGAFYVMINIEKAINKTYNNKEVKNSMDFANYLLEDHHVAVIPGIGFGSDSYVRMSYATSMDNIIEGLSRLEKAVTE